MTTLVLEELKTSLVQDFTFTTLNRRHIKAIGLKLYMHNAPTGTFTLNVKLGANILASVNFTSDDIKTDLSTTDNYCYLYKVLEFGNTLIVEGTNTYRLELTASSYSFTDSSYLGWIKSYENIFNDVDGNATSIIENAFDYIIYEQNNRGFRK